MIISSIVLIGSQTAFLENHLLPLGYHCVKAADPGAVAGIREHFGAVIVAQAALDTSQPLGGVEQIRLVTGEIPVLIYLARPIHVAQSLAESFALGTLEYLLDDEIESGFLPGKLDRLFVGTQVDQALRSLQADVDEKRGLQSELLLRKQVLEHERSINDSIVNAMIAGLLIVDLDGTIMRTNEHVRLIPGLDRTDLTGSHIDQIFGEPLHSIITRALHNCRNARPATAGKWSAANRHFEIAFYSMGPASKPTALLVVITDVTDLEQVTRQLYQAEKLATVGTMLSGIAHELRNPLSIISARAQRGLAKENPTSDWIRKSFESVVKQAERCAVLINSLLDFTRKTTAVSDIHSLNDIIEETLEYASYQRPFDQVSIRRELVEGLTVFGDRSRFVQVLLNICTNAADAMNGKGTLTVSTSPAQMGQISIRITDTGAGIPIELQEKIFDPFFTTKETGSGTGLGLAIARQIAGDSGGSLTVHSVPGSTTFTLLLPESGQGSYE